MAKATGPLFSLEAKGSVGKVIVFQGGSVRKHLVQHDAGAAGQVAQRGQFQGVTKLLKAGHVWLRTWWRDWLGKGWFTRLTGLLLADHARDLATQYLVWLDLLPGVQGLWTGAAPAKFGVINPGMNFFCVARVVWIYLLNGPTTWEMDGLLDPTNAFLSRQFWLRVGEFTYYTTSTGVQYTDDAGNFYMRAEEL